MVRRLITKGLVERWLVVIEPALDRRMSRIGHAGDVTGFAEVPGVDVLQKTFVRSQVVVQCLLFEI